VAMTAQDDADQRLSTLWKKRDMPATDAQNACGGLLAGALADRSSQPATRGGVVPSMHAQWQRTVDSSYASLAARSRCD
jgi:hypothetical protein